MDSVPGSLCMETVTDRMGLFAGLSPWGERISLLDHRVALWSVKKSQLMWEDVRPLQVEP